LIVANSFTQSRMYERESATYAAVFGPFYNLRASVEGNRVIVASRGTLPDKQTLKGNALALAAKLERFGIGVDTALGRFNLVRNDFTGVRPLRDQAIPNSP